jgi:hypothetical protein
MQCTCSRVKSKMKRQVRYTEEIKNIYKVLVEKSEWKDNLEDSV